MNDKKKYYMRGLGFGILISTVILMLVHADDRMTDEKAIKRAKELGYVLAEEVKATPSQTINMEEIKAKLTDTPAPTPVPTKETVPENTPEPTMTPIPTPIPSPTQVSSITSTPLPTSTPKPSHIVFATATPSLTPTPFPTATPKPTETPIPVPTATPVPAITSAPKATPTPVGTNTGNGNVVTAQITVEPGMPSYKVCSLVVNAGIVKDGDALSKYASAKGLEGNFQVGTFFLSSDMTYDEILSILTGQPIY